MTTETGHGDRSGEGFGDRPPAQSRHEPEPKGCPVPDVLTALDIDWPNFTRSGSAASSLRGWRETGAVDLTSFDDLLAALQDEADPEKRDRLVYRFAVLGRSDRDAARVVLQVVRPGLVSVVQRYQQ